MNTKISVPSGPQDYFQNYHQPKQRLKTSRKPKSGNSKKPRKPGQTGLILKDWNNTESSNSPYPGYTRNGLRGFNNSNNNNIYSGNPGTPMKLYNYPQHPPTETPIILNGEESPLFFDPNKNTPLGVSFGGSKHKKSKKARKHHRK